mmetsp:Transcript_3096/g.4208  ORF Transcript_3096/g.4208 Transcript_3096/m.4208 type:complete len:296 (-) Transcript_3096:135-1022(-)|eukprot:CAMPEP_0185260188 /NCGR_PEP_ID=MMETSP1359-20130426/8819_1 /TAXON_ID=552665 /ORGANISM="Bigelowiella longifila, Strain CCMP242" /LENGTH=295 /DNA_ID=CAMNT_0027846351 /DNA_START=116 /DNA_END=1003 /DNA_ORIENTATION=-
MSAFDDELAKFEAEMKALGGSQPASSSMAAPPPPPPNTVIKTSVKTTETKGQEIKVIKTVKSVKPVVSYSSAPVPSSSSGDYANAAALAKAALARVNSTLSAVGGLSNVVQNTVPPPPTPPPPQSISGGQWRGAIPPPPPEKEAPTDMKSMGRGKRETNKKKKNMRTAAGEIWEDKSLSEWPENDFRLFCGDLGNEVNDTVLAKAFAKYSSFAKAKVIRNKRTQKSKGYGFASFLDPFDAAAALREVAGKYVGNRPIKLRRSSWQQRALNDTTMKKRKYLKKGMPVKIKNSRMRF